MTGQDAPSGPPLLRPIDVQRRLQVGRTTVHDLHAAGLLLVGRRTPGGHRRYRQDSPALQRALGGAQ